jgi:hypothetical protein
MPHSDDALGTEVIGDVGVCCQRTTAGLCFQRKKKSRRKGVSRWLCHGSIRRVRLETCESFQNSL